jgi:hypothetical protein
MAVRLKNGSVFLHIPKTGGNWVTTILKELNLFESSVGHKHSDIDQYFAPHIIGRKALINYSVPRILRRWSKPEKPFMFCFVRNPISWYESWYNYMSMPIRNWFIWGDEYDRYNWHPNSILNGLGEGSFIEFVENVNKKRPGYVTELYGWYTKSQIDFIGKQENLADDLIKVLKIMGLDFDEDYIKNYKKINVATKNKLIWSNELKKETILLEYAGITRYGYQSDFKNWEL